MPPSGGVSKRSERRGKYLDAALEDEIHLLMHLRMDRDRCCSTAPAEVPHTRVVIGSRAGTCCASWTPDGSGRASSRRRRGAGRLLRRAAGRRAVRRGVLCAGAASSRARAPRPDQAVPARQRNVAGVGNIYADEALFRAGVHPLRAAGSLRPIQYALLRDAVRETLAAGIDARGASIR